MANFKYKDTPINDLIETGSTQLAGFVPIAYTTASPFSTERPLPFNYTQQTTQINSLMNAKVYDLPTTPGQYQVPTNYTKIRAVLEGGGGGGGGGGGCGVSGSGQPQSRQGGDGGARGANGGFTFVTDTAITQRAITFVVGAGGTGGGGGSAKGTVGQTTSQPGDDGGDGGAGQTSYITINGTTLYANAGTGGNGGQGGPNPGSSSTPGVTQLQNPGSVTFNIDGNQQTTAIPGTINPLSYKSSYSLNAGGGNAGTQSDPGPGNSGGTGQRGFIRLYLLKD
jgi:hypothetical protein